MMSFITMTEPKRRRGALRAPDQLGKENPSSSRISVYCQRHVPVGRRCCSGRAAFTGHPLPGGQVLRPIDPLILSQTRTTFSFLVFLPVLGFWRGWKHLRLPPKDALQTLLIGVLGVAASNYFYYLAIQRTNVATAIILQYTASIWVMLS